MALVLRNDNPAPRAVCLVGSAVALGIAIHIRDGLVHPGAMVWLSLSIVLAAGGFVRLPAGSLLACRGARAMAGWIAGGIFLQFALLLCSHTPEGWQGLGPRVGYHATIVAAALLVAGMVFFPRRANVLFPLVLLAFALTGVWVLNAPQHPRIDVWTSQMAGLDALRHGADPWSSSFADVYHLPDLYAPGTVRDGVVHLGFPYPPLTVLLDLPGYWMLGDFRYSNLAAMLLTAMLIAYARPGRWGPLLATLFLFTPRAFLVLRNGWTEPQVAMLLAATVFCACRLPRATPWVLGLFLVSKQYVPLAALPAMLLIQRRWSVRTVAMFMAKAGVAGAVVSLPLALWNTRAFLHSTFLVAGGAKFRLDALSYFAYFANVSDWTPAGWLGSVSFVAAVVTGVVMVRRAERSPAGFAGAVGMVFLVFFALNKFAFCNYYYFVIGAMCAGAAALAGVKQERMPKREDDARSHPLAA